MNGTRLYRSPTDRVIAGVAGGMAETYGWDPALARIVWTLLILVTGGTLLILYIVMALVIPLRPEPLPPGYVPPGYAPPGYAPPPAGFGPPPGEATATATTDETTAANMTQPTDAWSSWRQERTGRRTDIGGGLVIGLLLILIGVFFLVRNYLPAIDIGRLWPVLVIGLGLVLLVAAFARRAR